MTGPEAVRLFYDPRRFVRRSATPKAIQKTLLGEGGVQGLDDGVPLSRGIRGTDLSFFIYCLARPPCHRRPTSGRCPRAEELA